MMKCTRGSKRKLEVHTDASLMRKLRKGPMEYHAGYTSNNWLGSKTCSTTVSSCPKLSTRSEMDPSHAAEENELAANGHMVQSTLRGDSQHTTGSKEGKSHVVYYLSFLVLRGHVTM